MNKARNLGAVERERERESYTLKTISEVLLINLIYIIKKKGNIIVPCGYYDTG